jgi:hypothetical protein
MFMKQAVTTREISFKSSLVKVERFSDKELEDLVGDEEVKE